jgi:hypothetical protein
MLPDQFFEYLGEDGVFVPVTSSLDRDQLSDDEEEEETKSSDLQKNTQYKFPEVEASIAEALHRYDGQVFVKLNWSAPLDAAWINGGSMKCQTVHDVFLLLKASHRISFDVDRMFELVPAATIRRPRQLALILRKWANLHPSMEFRAFVYNGRIVGLCQRNCTTYFPFLVKDMVAITPQLLTFLNQQLLPNAPLQSCEHSFLCPFTLLYKLPAR